MDVILAFPQIMLALVAIATLGRDGLADRARRRADDDAARRTRHARRGPADRRARLRRVGRGARRLATRASCCGEILPNILSPLMVEASLRLTYSIGLIAALAFLGFSPESERRQLGHDDPGEPDRARSRSRGASCCPSWRSRCSRSARASSATARARRDRHRPRDGGRVSTDRRPTVAVEGRLRSRPARHRDRHRRRGLVLDRSPARCSASSASPAPARRPSASRCSATRGAAPRSPAAASASATSTSSRSRAQVARCALRGRLVSYVPQDPAAALNPALRIGTQLRRDARGARLRLELGSERRDARRRDDARGRAARRRAPTCAATRTSSPAASSSASAWRWRSPAARA